MDPVAARAFAEESMKLAERFRATADIARKIGLPRAGDGIEGGGRAAAYKLYKTLNYKIPGTGDTRLPFLTPRLRHKLTMNIANNPHLLPAAVSPVPGSMEAGAGITYLGNALARRMGLTT
jgi:hypothetical protein